MGEEFNKLVEEEGEAKAWQVYGDRLMGNIGTLSRIMSPKDVTDMRMKIGESIRGKGQELNEKTPMDEVREFLSGKAN